MHPSQWLVLPLVLIAPAFAQEALRYSINYASGLSLGEASLISSKTKIEGQERWGVQFELDASVPGFAVSDRFQSVATGGFCSLELEKTTKHGKRSTSEKTEFDAKTGYATRQTRDGGKSKITIKECARDALTYVMFVRKQLAAGKVPPPETVLFGAEYRVRSEFKGSQTVPIGDKPTPVERLVATVKGPASDVTFEMFFAKDEARTPVLVKVPLKVGTLSMELVR